MPWPCYFDSPDFWAVFFFRRLQGGWESFFLRAVVCMLGVDCSLKYVGKIWLKKTSCVFCDNL